MGSSTEATNSSDEEDEIIVAAAATTVFAAVAYYEQYMCKTPCRNLTLGGYMRIQEILNGNPSRCRDLFRMDNRVFLRLCEILHSRHLLRNIHGVTIEEQVAVFLVTVGNYQPDRVLQETFRHSNETINRYFNNVLNAILGLVSDLMQKPNDQTPPEILNNPMYFPYFKDCVGVIDGIHIPAFVAVNSKGPFRNRKGFVSQNVMAACSFDLRFQYVLAGWEGSATDSRVLSDALTRTDGLHVPEGKYYLVDASYRNVSGFLAPYHECQYHQSEFSGSNPPENARELFNNRHSSLRSVIERIFWILKARFPILKIAPPYPFNVQVKLVMALCIIHNHIRTEKKNDWLFKEYGDVIPNEDDDENERVKPEEPSQPISPAVFSQGSQQGLGAQLRDSIAEEMWRNRL